MYDLIGDIHGYAQPLKQLLQSMGYSESGGVWHHPDRQVIFVGDYIDRGPAIREVLQIVRVMVDSGNALAIMGNHEYNALAYAYPIGENRYLRSHNPVHTRQHQATLEQFANHDSEWQDWLEWFYTLPLYLDLGNLRVVHACWDQEHIDWLAANHQGKLSKHLLESSHIEGSHPNIVIEETLKGKEFNIPEKFAWSDKDGHLRKSNRIKWWIHPGNSSFGDYLFNCPESLQQEKITADLKIDVYPADAPPVFFGHYCMEDAYPVIQTENVICLDYSIAKGGNLVAYRWSGERKCEVGNFVIVKGE